LWAAPRRPAKPLAALAETVDIPPVPMRRNRSGFLSHLDNDDVRRLLQKRALEAIYRPRPAKRLLPPGAKAELYDVAAAHIGNEPIVYLEFGVASGASLQAMMQRFSHQESRYFGFDSFEGLPEQWLNHARGTFSQKGKMPNITDPRVTFVKGWFQNSLPGFLAEQKFDPKSRVLVHFDADLYSSTLFILCNLWPVFDSYFFIFDEFVFDEVVALHDFSLAFPVDIEFLANTDVHGLPAQSFGAIRRIEFRLPARPTSPRLFPP
jgi:hypothetical protein